MAIDMFSEGSSPRISFSLDLHTTSSTPLVENHPYRSDSLLLDSSSDFDFSISQSIDIEPSSADELFSNGLILPLQPQQKFVTSMRKPSHLASLPPLPNPPKIEVSKNENSKEMILGSLETDQKHQLNKSFWPFRRSSSVNCDKSRKKSSFWSLPLLTRSNSTGSEPSSKQMSKDNQKQNPNSSKQMRNSMAMSSSSLPSSSTSSSGSYVYSISQKPPLKKNYGGSYGSNGIRVNPVLNVPHPSITKGTANLLGSLFGNGKDKKTKK